jgi:hypothetical protein
MSPTQKSTSSAGETVTTAIITTVLGAGERAMGRNPILSFLKTTSAFGTFATTAQTDYPP